MGRRQFSREFKLEAVRLVKERGVSVVQASRDLDVGENILRRWIKELTADPGQAFPGQGQVKPEQQEIDRLRREVAKLKAERDILKKAAVGSTGRRNAGSFAVFQEDPRWRARVDQACRVRRNESCGPGGNRANHSAPSAGHSASTRPRCSASWLPRVA